MAQPIQDLLPRVTAFRLLREGLTRPGLTHRCRNSREPVPGVQAMPSHCPPVTSLDTSMLPSSLIRCSSSSKTSSSSGWMYLLRGGWGARLCWNGRLRWSQGQSPWLLRHIRDMALQPDPPWLRGKLPHRCPQGSVLGSPCEQASLTSSLTSRRMDGWSDMDLKRVPTTQHFSPGCSSHSFFVWTPLPRHSGYELRDQVALQAPHRALSIAAQVPGLCPGRGGQTITCKDPWT